MRKEAQVNANADGLNNLEKESPDPVATTVPKQVENGKELTDQQIAIDAWAAKKKAEMKKV